MTAQQNVALVTGGSRGIGRAICLGLAARGVAVAVNYVSNPEAAQEVVAAVEAAGGRGLAVQADVGTYEQVEAMVAQVLAHFGRVDILVNNAGIILRDPLLETSPDDWHRVFAVNVDGTFYCTQAVASHMVERGGGGQIINISSINSAIGIARRSCYAATKGAIEAFTRVVALELAPHGIQVNVIAPGITETDMSAVQSNSDARRTLLGRLPAGRVATAEEIALPVVAMALGEMPYVVGQVLRIDGGWSSCDIDYTRRTLSE